MSGDRLPLRRDLNLCRVRADVGYLHPGHFRLVSVVISPDQVRLLRRIGAQQMTRSRQQT